MSIGALVKNKNSSCEEQANADEKQADEGQAEERCFFFSWGMGVAAHTHTCIHTNTCMHTYMYAGVVSSSKAFGTHHSS